MVVMEQLGDDELTSILNKISDKNDLKSFSRVSKSFLKVACFRLVRLDNRFTDMLFDILPASPNMVSFTCFKPLSNTHLILLSHSCPKLVLLRLGGNKPFITFMSGGKWSPKDFDHDYDFGESDSDTNELFDDDFDDDGLCAVANACNNLWHVCLIGRLNIGDVGVTSLLKSSFKNLHLLNLKGCVNVSDESLKAIGESTRLRNLGLKGCRLITDLGLEYLSNGDLKNCLEVLVLAECDRISDTGIISLKKIVGLKRLHLDKCGVNITDYGVVTLLFEIQNIEELDLSWLINITDISLLFITMKCLKLWSIYLNGCEAITSRGVGSFTHHPTLETFELYSCHSFSWEDVELVASTCPCLEFFGLSRRIKTPMPEPGIEDYDCENKCVMISWK